MADTTCTSTATATATATATVRTPALQDMLCPSTCMELIIASGAFPCRAAAAADVTDTRHQHHTHPHTPCDSPAHLAHMLAWRDTYHATWAVRTTPASRPDLMPLFSVMAVWRGLRACERTWGALARERDTHILVATDLIPDLITLITSYTPVPPSVTCCIAALDAFVTFTSTQERLMHAMQELRRVLSPHVSHVLEHQSRCDIM